MRSIYKTFLISLAFVILSGSSTSNAASYNYTILDINGANRTQAYGINNDGIIVGNYRDNNYTYHSFVFDGVNYKTFSVPGASSTYSYGINDQLQIVGTYDYYDGGKQIEKGFLYNGATYTTIIPPGSTNSYIRGINSLGMIVGEDDSRGLVYQDGNFTFFDYIPGATNIMASGINNHGNIVGTYWNAPGGPGYYHGFVYNGSSYNTIDFPNARDTALFGINNSGKIVGIYSDLWYNTHSFLFDGIKFSEIRMPNDIATTAWGINDKDQIVGYFRDLSGNDHGFLMTPVPLPPTFWLFGSGLIGLIGLRRFRRS